MSSPFSHCLGPRSARPVPFPPEVAHAPLVALRARRNIKWTLVLASQCRKLVVKYVRGGSDSPLGEVAGSLTYGIRRGVVFGPETERGVAIGSA